MKSRPLCVEERLTFTVGAKALDGVLTRPETKGSLPAIVLLHGSDRSGVEDPYYMEHAQNMVRSGFGVLRYDGPGWGGRSSEGPGFETLEYRTDEAIAAVKYLQSRPDINPDAVGLWGISQGGWICQMAAAAYDDVAFIVPVSGPGVTPAEQEVYRVEAQSRAAGFDDDEVARAVLMRRLMVDIVLPEPVYQALNQAEAMRLGVGPWDRMVALVYPPAPTNPSTELQGIIDVLHAIKNDPWTQFLHLDQVLPMFESLPPEHWEGVKAQMRTVMDVNPADFLTRVHCPVLAIFGEQDTSIPVDRSVVLYDRHLKEAGNHDVTIKVFPDANHTIRIDDEFAPGYFEAMNQWLINLYDR